MSFQIKQRKKDFIEDAEKLIRKAKDYETMQNELMDIVPYVGMLKQSNSEKNQLQENLKRAEVKYIDQKHPHNIFSDCHLFFISTSHSSTGILYLGKIA